MRFGKMEKILDVPKPAATNDFLIDRAIWHFTRGMELVSQKDATAAAWEQSELANLADSDDIKKLDSPGFPAASVLAVAKHWLAGRVAELHGRPEIAISELRIAQSNRDRRRDALHGTRVLAVERATHSGRDSVARRPTGKGGGNFSRRFKRMVSQRLGTLRVGKISARTKQKRRGRSGAPTISGDLEKRRHRSELSLVLIQQT